MEEDSLSEVDVEIFLTFLILIIDTKAVAYSFSCPQISFLVILYSVVFSN